MRVQPSIACSAYVDPTPPPATPQTTPQSAEAREREAQARLGDQFDLRRFHSVVIGSGGMPLETLGAHVERSLRAPEGADA